MTSLSLTVKGVTLSDHRLRTILSELPDDCFSRDDFVTVVTRHSWPAGLSVTEALRPILQHLKRKGVIAYDQGRKCWSKTGPVENQPPETLPLNAVDAGDSRNPASPQTTSWLARIETFLIAALSRIVAICLVAALVAINAGFAWQLSETSVFRIAFTLGFAAVDGLRPLLVARALCLFQRRKRVLALLTLTIALVLAPASIVSSTLVISSALILGTETLHQKNADLALSESLRSELVRLQSQTSRTWDAYAQECDRGGCGAIAEGLRQKAEALEVELAAVRSELLALNNQKTITSTFSSRVVETLQSAGFGGDTVKLLLPIFLALTLEIAALFGPALLLMPRATK